MASPYTKEQIIDALHANKGMVTLAADMLKCNPQTIYNWMKRSPDVRAVLEHEREKVIDVAEIALMAAIQRKEGWAIAFALKTIGKQRGYVERLEIDVRSVALVKQIETLSAQRGVEPSDIFNDIIAELSAQPSPLPVDSESADADSG